MSYLIPARPFRALLLVLAACALAPAMQAAFPTAAQILKAFKALDASGNEAINLTEWDRGTEALFQAADRDHNGFIDASELPGTTIAQDTFLRIGRKDPTKLSKQEFIDARRQLFNAADIDRNGNVELVEYELLIVFEQVGWNDRNGSERVEPSELKESLLRVIQTLDTDQDGLLSAAEAAYMRPTAFAAYDLDKDGFLTLEELLAGYRKELGG